MIYDEWNKKPKKENWWLEKIGEKRNMVRGEKDETEINDDWLEEVNGEGK